MSDNQSNATFHGLPRRKNQRHSSVDRLPIIKKKQRIMVGSRSTPILRHITTNNNKSNKRKDCYKRNKMVATASTSDSKSSSHSSVFIPDPMKLHRMLSEEDSNTNKQNEKPVVQHTKEELKYYLKCIQSGIKPDPVILPIVRWPKGILPPPSVSSSIATGSIASTPLSQLSRTARDQQIKWMYSSDNPAVFPIRKEVNESGDYLFDGAANVYRNGNEKSSIVDQQETYAVNGQQQQRQRNEKTKKYKRHQNSKNCIKDQMLMPPEQSPIAERINKSKVIQDQLLKKLREKSDIISTHLFNNMSTRRPTNKGSIAVNVLKEELQTLLCKDESTKSRSMTHQHFTVKDIDQLLSFIPKEQLDVNGNVDVNKLLSNNNNDDRKDNESKYGGNIMLSTIIPFDERPNQNASIERNSQSTFTRTVVPDVKSGMYCHPKITFNKNVANDLNLEEKIKKNNYYNLLNQRNLDRAMSISTRCEMELHQRDEKLNRMLKRKQFVQNRYNHFLEKEALRRMKQGNRYALNQYHQTNPKRRGNAHQYIQEIGGSYRNQIVSEYNKKRANLDRRLWNKVFR